MNQEEQPFQWHRAETSLDGKWSLMADTGWDFLILWAAGAGNVGRAEHLSGAARNVRVSTVRDGLEEVHYEEQTSLDKDAIDDSFTSFLREADVPPPPPGFDWFIRIPFETSRGEFFQDLNARLMGAQLSAAPRPSEWLPVMVRELRDLYLAHV